MTKEILVIIFNIVFFINNLFYIELIEGIFDTKSKKRKIILFSFSSSITGTLMLLFFGSMSALGYSITLCVYTITIMLFYKDQGVTTRMASVLYFNIHIMVSRALISAVAALILNTSIIELSSNPISFWIILIYTALLCALINIIILKLIPKKYLIIMGQRTDYLRLYIAMLVAGNIYLIANGNVYIHSIDYSWLPLHQIIAALTWLAIVYVGIFVLVGFDILRERKEALEKHSIYKNVMETRSIAVIEINCTKDKIITFTKRGETEEISDISYTEYSHSLLNEITFPDDYEVLLQNLTINNMINNYNLNELESSIDCRILFSDGTLRWVRFYISTRKDVNSGDVIAIVAIMDDIHETKLKELALMRKAQIDPLVGAYNKKATEYYIKEHLLHSKNGALFMIDLDNFKGINDNFGHSYGDDVLKEVYSKISNHFRSDDIIGRIGGDEFIVFLKNSINIEEISVKAKALCDDIEKEYTKNKVTVKISSSIGVSIAPSHGKTFADLYHNADLAMYACKKNTKNGYVIYSNKISDSLN